MNVQDLQQVARTLAGRYNHAAAEEHQVRACGWTREEGVRGGSRDLVKGVKELALRLVVLVWVQQQLAYPLDRERRPAACGAPHRAQLGRKRCTGCVCMTQRVRDIGPGVGQELLTTSPVAIPISARIAW